MTPGQLAEFAAKVQAAHAAVRDKGPDSPEWVAWFGDHKGIQGTEDRWKKRPYGRDAAPGDISGGQLPGERPYDGNWKCRRCLAVSSPDGHPHGCPRTPGDFSEQYQLNALRRCYCGQALVVAPETFGPCCQDTLPVQLPGGCRWCGSDLCRVGDPDDQPERDDYVEACHPEMGKAWVHARCVDERLLTRRSRDDEVARRRVKRATPLGVTNP